MVRIFTDIKYSLTAFFRNKGAVFWSFIFPIILFVLLGSLLGNQSSSITLYYVDNDNSAMSAQFINALNSTGAVTLVNGAGMNLSRNLTDGKISSYIVIPQGFETNAMAASMPGANATGATMELYYDKSQSISAATVSIVNMVADKINIKLSGAKDLINVKSQDVATSNVNYLDFLFPGIIGMSVMSIAVNGTVGQSARNRATGVFRKLATTPISRIRVERCKDRQPDHHTADVACGLDRGGMADLQHTSEHQHMDDIDDHRGRRGLFGTGQHHRQLRQGRGHGRERSQRSDIPPDVRLRVVLLRRLDAVVLTGPRGHIAVDLSKQRSPERDAYG